MKNETQLEDFKQYLKDQGKGKAAIDRTVNTVRRFLRHVGEQRLDRISEEVARSFFAGIKAVKTRQMYAMEVSQFLNFSVSRLPVPLNARGVESPQGAAAPTKKELALREKWTVDKLREQKEADKDLIAKLARKVIDHYVFFQTLLKTDERVDLDTVSRFADECRDLIETNLPLFMSLSAQGRNIHSAIDERVQR